MLSLLFILSMTQISKPLHIDLTAPRADSAPVDLGLGACVTPFGETVSADGTRLYRNGKPWIPVMGEFHYARVPESEWRESLLKMKAGGVDVVSSYVFWIHHEEVKGQWDWTGQRNLAKFLEVCHQVGMLAVVRLGPWCHGEVRNGGFPDWIQNSSIWAGEGPFKNRDVIPEFMASVSTLYAEIARQLKGKLWKEGGPVIAVQVDNECWNLNYLHALKKLAREHGIDVPFTTMTGWNNVPLPESDLIPLFGGYADGFWVDDKLSMRKTFQFTPTRDDGDMGAVDGKIINLRPDRDDLAARFPYLCCEIGGGMPSSYDNWLHVTPLDTAALALIKLGSGSNLPGYYMYHGGTNPEGKLTSLNETKATGYPNDLPVKNYDFEAPIGAAGQIRDQWFLLRSQHQFLNRFGDLLSAMPTIFPSESPKSFEDIETVRWTMRADQEKGFLFLCNHQRYQELPDHSGVQFSVKTSRGIQLIPRKPMRIPSGTLAIFPVGIDFSGVRVEYATVQPLGRLESNGEVYEFLAEIKGVPSELCFGAGADDLASVRPGRGAAVRRKSSKGQWVNFVVLSPEDALHFSLVELGGRLHAVVSTGAVFASDSDSLSVQVSSERESNLAIFPPVIQVRQGDTKLSAGRDELFTVFRGVSLSPPQQMPVTLLHPGSEQPGPATEESSWKQAAEYSLAVPPTAHHLLRISYFGYAARIYSHGKLVLDQYWNGREFDLPLWRLSDSERRNLTLKILPWRLRSGRILDESVKFALDAAAKNPNPLPSAHLVDRGDVMLHISV